MKQFIAKDFTINTPISTSHRAHFNTQLTELILVKKKKTKLDFSQTKKKPRFLESQLSLIKLH